MGVNIKGMISDQDPTYLKHAKVLIACAEAGIKELPKETSEYFGSKYPEKCLLEEKLEVRIPFKEYQEDVCEFYEIDVKNIPVGVEKIKISNCY